MRLLIGCLLVDTTGSLLAMGVLHAAFNASGRLSVSTAVGERTQPNRPLGVLPRDDRHPHMVPWGTSLFDDASEDRTHLASKRRGDSPCSGPSHSQGAVGVVTTVGRSALSPRCSRTRAPSALPISAPSWVVTAGEARFPVTGISCPPSSCPPRKPRCATSPQVNEVLHGYLTRRSDDRP